jgi:uncharacterized MAPEG superfamily protein
MNHGVLAAMAKTSMGVSKNHHPKSISTSPKKSAAQKFRATEPFSETLIPVKSALQHKI